MKLKTFLFLLIMILNTFAVIEAQNTPVKAKLMVSGQEFEYLRKGNGQKGKIGDFIKFGILVAGDNGQVFVDRRTEPNFGLDKIIAVDSSVMPVVEMVYTLAVGDSVRMVVPLDEENKIPGHEDVKAIVYTINAVEILDEATMQALQAAESEKQAKLMETGKAREAEVKLTVDDLLKKYNAGELKKDIIKTNSGLEYYVVNKATGAKVQNGEMISVDYFGALISDGSSFDNSFGRGQKIQFTAGAGQMIKGWDEAMLLLNHGDISILFIPYQLAYGEAGRPPVIPEKANLTFYIEIE
jgi:FKBP-type peptidyl-prolyl cis-trans isomerase